jgi:hypothetical protein
MDGSSVMKLLPVLLCLKKMAKDTIGTVGTLPELLKKFRFDKELDSGTLSGLRSHLSVPKSSDGYVAVVLGG